MIDWHSKANIALINPRTPAFERQRLLDVITQTKEFDAHFFIATSGSGRIKWTALAKKAVLSSAAAVNQHLESLSSDIWLNVLPTFHVGGLGVLARAYLSGAKVIDYSTSIQKWNSHIFVETITNEQVTLTSLVPTQIFDIVAAKLPAPARLRAVIVGGGGLAPKLYEAAVGLRWPLLPSYGLTECSSQVATAALNSWTAGAYPLLQPLSHIQLDKNDDGCLKIKSAALLSAYVELTEQGSNIYNPKCENWFITEDVADLAEEKIIKITRHSNFIKIGGESVDLERLEEILKLTCLRNTCTVDCALISLPDERLGHVIHLAVAASSRSSCIEKLVESFNASVLAFERIRHIHYLEQIPRSSLQKVQRNKLQEICKSIVG